MVSELRLGRVKDRFIGMDSPFMENYMLILGSIRCVLAPKFFAGARTHEITKTQKSFGEIPPGLYLVKIINIFKWGS